MKIRLGYVAMAIDLKDASPSKTISYTNYNKIIEDEVKLYRLKKITEENLNNTRRILLYNVAHDIKLYRITSKLVPLATHPEVLSWDYVEENKGILRDIQSIIKDNNLRVSAHPDHFTILASPKEDVVKASIDDLVYHNNIMEGLGLSPSIGKLVLHIGGKYNSKEETVKRFINNFSKLEASIKDRIILENDDKIYSVIDVLKICENLKIPMVLDIHHHWCNNRGENLQDYIGRIFNTWNEESLIPKVHISSPKSEKDFRAHADNIDFEFFNSFVGVAKQLDRDFDMMIEAKNKNMALFDLMENIKEDTRFKVIDGATIKI